MLLALIFPEVVVSDGRCCAVPDDIELLVSIALEHYIYLSERDRFDRKCRSSHEIHKSELDLILVCKKHRVAQFKV